MYIKEQEILFQHAIEGLSEGFMLISREKQTIIDINRAGAGLLSMPRESLVGQTLREAFFGSIKNDSFVETILDAVYEKDEIHEKAVDYYSAGGRNVLFVRTSYVVREEKNVGVVVLFSDITELCTLRDLVAASEKIKRLMRQVEERNKLLEMAFGRYMTEAVVSEILNRPDGMEIKGIRRNITVMMSDLRSFTAISERMLAEDLFSMLNNYLYEMTAVISAYNGTILEIEGDGILTVFGAPVVAKDHAGNAVACALAMQNAMQEVNKWNASKGYPMLEMGIGINTGEALVGNLGSALRSKYSVIGSLVNICSRIESYSIGGQVLVGPETLKRLKTPVKKEKSISVYPKGCSTPLDVSLVSAIYGDYNVIKSESGKMELSCLDIPEAVTFRTLNEKRISFSELKGNIISVCENGMLFTANEELNLYENIVFFIGENLYAKIIEKEENAYLAAFTGRPDSFSAWLMGLQRK